LPWINFLQNGYLSLNFFIFLLKLRFLPLSVRN